MNASSSCVLTSDTQKRCVENSSRFSKCASVFLFVSKKKKKKTKDFFWSHIFFATISLILPWNIEASMCVCGEMKKKIFINFIIIDKSDEKRSEWLVYCEINKYDAFILYYLLRTKPFGIHNSRAVRCEAMRSCIAVYWIQKKIGKMQWSEYSFPLGHCTQRAFIFTGGSTCV